LNNFKVFNHPRFNIWWKKSKKWRWLASNAFYFIIYL